MNGLTCIGLTLLAIIGGVALALLRQPPSVDLHVDRALSDPRYRYTGPIPPGRWVDTE